MRRALLLSEEVVQFVHNIRSMLEDLESVESGNVLLGYVRRVMLKAAMNE